MTATSATPPALGEPIATRVLDDQSGRGPVTVEIGRPQPWYWEEADRSVYACPYRISGGAPDDPGGGDSYAKGIDEMDALTLAVHAIESVLYLWNERLGRQLRWTAGHGSWRLSYPSPEPSDRAR
ncbi:DUF6968 family protein [Nocardia sp. NBC_01388]|uniref:DUF6968 family protein n=1 Tax=Nocardia sp. NBC_01388 TaxID=2903596 RepID=UPI0032507A04